MSFKLNVDHAYYILGALVGTIIILLSFIAMRADSAQYDNKQKKNFLCIQQSQLLLNDDRQAFENCYFSSWDPCSCLSLIKNKE